MEPAAKRARAEDGSAVAAITQDKINEIIQTLRDNNGMLPLDNILFSADVTLDQLKSGNYPWLYVKQPDGIYIKLKTAPGAGGGAGPRPVRPAAGNFGGMNMQGLQGMMQAMQAMQGMQGMQGAQDFQGVMAAGLAAGLAAAMGGKGGGGDNMGMNFGGGFQKPQQFLDWNCPSCGDLQFQKNSVCRKCGTPNPNHNVSEEFKQQLELFITTYPFEEHALQSFKDMTPDLQQLVMSKGSMDGVRDPTAVLIGRMRDARNGLMMGGLGGGPVGALPGDWYCPSCGDHQFQRNKNCRRCGTANPKHETTDEWRQEVEKYIQDFAIEVHVAEKFRELTPDLQKAVMNKGPLTEARDPTAVVMDRVRRARRGDLNEGGGNTQQPLPGDWFCPSCNDHQFARNATCRRCGTANPLGADLPMTPDQFLSQYPVEPHAAELFRALAPAFQKLVMDKGSLADARDPTAVLMRRMADARHGRLQEGMAIGVGAGNTAKPLPGDWYCPSCNDLQFKNNQNCRRCGTANPMVGGAAGGATATAMQAAQQQQQQQQLQQQQQQQQMWAFQQAAMQGQGLGGFTGVAGLQGTGMEGLAQLNAMGGMGGLAGMQGLTGMGMGGFTGLQG